MGIADITDLRTYIANREMQIINSMEACIYTPILSAEMHGRRDELASCLTSIDLYIKEKGEPK